MDAFYASVEQKDNPELRGKPVAVGGNKERGVVAAASYEARKFGVKSAMPSAIAARQCPHLIFIRPRFDRYKEISDQIREIFLEYTDQMEPLSLDEAYLDVTSNKKGMASATLIAREIRTRIFDTTGLTASAGVSFNKFLAKTASDVNKPNGIFVILPDDAEQYLHKLPVQRFFGIGSATAEKMKNAGIFTGADLKTKSLEDLTRRFGKSGAYYYNICRGIDMREVEPYRERKSVSTENTFTHNLMRLDQVNQELRILAEETFKRYAKEGKTGKTVTIKVKYGDFRQVTRSHTAPDPFITQEQVLAEIDQLVDNGLLRDEGIRLLGVGISNFQKSITPEPTQLTLGF